MSFLSFIQNSSTSYAAYFMQETLLNELSLEILTDNFQKIPNPNKKYMLYAHIPFCHTFCPYCSFHKYIYDKEIAKKYFVNLRLEMAKIKDAGYDFGSMYVGGGTTLINEDELIKTLEYAKSLFSIDEISAESDPNHISPPNLMRFKGLIDRLSIGVQSFDDDILKKIARYDKFGSSKQLYDKLSASIGILPITSLDLIFNFPFQSKKSLLNDIYTAKSLDPDQITFYPLMKSNLTKQKIAASFGGSSDFEREFYELINSEFKEYHKNNAWSFSKYRLNLKDEYVSTYHEYVGVGSGAFSFLDGELSINAFDLDDYDSLISTKANAVVARCKFKQKSRLKYLFLTELFTGKVDIDKFNAECEVNLKNVLFKEIWLLRLVGAIRINKNLIELTDFGCYLCVVLMKEFYIGMDALRAIFKDGAKLKKSKRLRVMSQALSMD